MTKSRTVDIEIVSKKGTTHYLPKWKQIIAKILSIPVKELYEYVINTYGQELMQGELYKINIDGYYFHFICTGDASFAAIKECRMKSYKPTKYQLYNMKYRECSIVNISHGFRR